MAKEEGQEGAAEPPGIDRFGLDRYGQERLSRKKRVLRAGKKAKRSSALLP